jgi:cell fate regulator YaaT (PSP1 superfamily)
VERQLDGKRMTFYFTAEGRVDFRELVRDLTGRFHTRVELRQIGARDDAGMQGGCGLCGRVLCCSDWIRGFDPVSIKMAKNQGLSLNPAKISGMCGRLMCCLRFEYDPRQDPRRRGADTATPGASREDSPASDDPAVLPVVS